MTDSNIYLISFEGVEDTDLGKSWAGERNLHCAYKVMDNTGSVQKITGKHLAAVPKEKADEVVQKGGKVLWSGSSDRVWSLQPCDPAQESDPIEYDVRTGKRIEKPTNTPLS